MRHRCGSKSAESFLHTQQSERRVNNAAHMHGMGVLTLLSALPVLVCSPVAATGVRTVRLHAVGSRSAAAFHLGSTEIASLSVRLAILFCIDFSLIKNQIHAKILWQAPINALHL